MSVKIMAIAFAVTMLGGIQLAYAQTTVVSSSTETITAVATLLGAVGVILGILVPYIGKISKEAGMKAKAVADSLIETDHYGNDLATNIKKNQVDIEATKAAIETLILKDPDAKKRWDELQAQAIEKMKVVTEESKKDTQELAVVHNALQSMIAGKP